MISLLIGFYSDAINKQRPGLHERARIGSVHRQEDWVNTSTYTDQDIWITWSNILVDFVELWTFCIWFETLPKKLRNRLKQKLPLNITSRFRISYAFSFEFLRTVWWCPSCSIGYVDVCGTTIDCTICTHTTYKLTGAGFNRNCTGNCTKKSYTKNIRFLKLVSIYSTSVAFRDIKRIWYLLQISKNSDRSFTMRVHDNFCFHVFGHGVMTKFEWWQGCGKILHKNNDQQLG